MDFIFYAEVQPILFKDSANEREISSLLEYFSQRVRFILSKDSAKLPITPTQVVGGRFLNLRDGQRPIPRAP